MRQFIFNISPDSSFDDAYAELQTFMEHLYEIDHLEAGVAQIAGFSDISSIPPLQHAILHQQLADIDWQAQWAAHAPGFRDGLSHIDLSTYGTKTELLLKPGRSFGDFSHPTTRLSLKLLAPLIKEKILIDIGSGSGILSIAAVLLGAKAAYGIEIDKKAITHAEENALLNQVQTQVRFADKIPPLAEPSLIVMNMIEAEQKAAWTSISPYLNNFLTITSGILSTDRQRYLQWTQTLGWVLQHTESENGWDAFVFSSADKK